MCNLKSDCCTTSAAGGGLIRGVSYITVLYYSMKNVPLLLLPSAYRSPGLESAGTLQPLQDDLAIGRGQNSPRSPALYLASSPLQVSMPVIPKFRVKSDDFRGK